MVSEPAKTPAFYLREIWFWAAVMEDHATMIHDNLGPDEKELIAQASKFKEEFGRLRMEAERTSLDAGLTGRAGVWALEGLPEKMPVAQGYQTQAVNLTKRYIDLLVPLRAFKQEIVQRQLDCKIVIHLPPSLIQHMINEANESIRMLTPGAQHPPPMEALHLHLVWLRDASGHAGALKGGLDPTEQELDKILTDFQKVFDGLNIKAIELESMLRVAPRMIGALQRLNLDSYVKIDAFRAFLEELREHLAGCEILGTLMPMMAEHMMREELYYMEKLLEVKAAS